MAALLAAACSSRPPPLMLVIDGEASVRVRTTRIELDVRGAEGGQAFGQSYDLTMRGWPIRKSLGNGTWVLNGNTWTTIAVADALSGHNAMVYDSQNQRIVLSGGGNGTWELRL